MKRSFTLALFITATSALAVLFTPTSLTKHGEAGTPEPGIASRRNSSFLKADSKIAGLGDALSPSDCLSVNSTSVSGGNGNAVIDRNECNSLNVTLTNMGCGDLTGVSAVLSTSTPGVVISQPNSPYPNIAVGANGTNTVPFGVSTSSSFACGPINLVLTLSSDQGTFTVNFSPASCSSAPTMVSGSITNTDPLQTGRLNRNQISSTCAAPKTFPGLFLKPGTADPDTTPRH